MNQLLRTLLLVILITPAGLAMAHSDHGTISADAAVQIAYKTVQQMTFKDSGYPLGKLDNSWKSVNPDDIEVVEVGDGYYVLRISQSESKQFLLMKIAATGQVVEAEILPANAAIH
ncbi:MAG: DUF6488 family protein [Pseudomonadales bacterium]|jgi:hypothetical protein|nr:DUF6488 family protein [Pseudomonadales bacterium]